MKSEQTAIYLTTPLYYVNAEPHLGHYFTTALVDIVSKHYRQRGKNVTFLTGVDEHGEKIDHYAKKAGMAPQAWADEYSAKFLSIWNELRIDYDIFYRTTAPGHKKAVQFALQNLKDKGEIEFREYSGNYCLGCERFRTDQELTPDGHCPDHKTKPEFRKEENYFFLMSKYQKRLIQFYEDHPDAIRPNQYRNEILSHLKEPLEDLCISRPKSRTEWGIEFPFDKKFVTYVWFDALLNYLVATGWPDKMDSDKWSTVRHFLAKDIVRTHAVYWPTMLMALGVEPFQELNVHGYLINDGAKMSKSLGNVINPITMSQALGRENLRFYFMKEMSFGLDSTFTLEHFYMNSNAFLANGIGNLTSRVLTLVHKGFKGEIPYSAFTDEDRALIDKRRTTLDEWNLGFETLKFHHALKAWTDLSAATDLYVNNQKPWALAKDPAQSDRLQVVLGVCLLTIRALGAMIFPVMDETSKKILTALGSWDDSQMNLKKGPPLSFVTEEPANVKIAAEIPRLFERLQMPESPAQT